MKNQEFIFGETLGVLEQLRDKGVRADAFINDLPYGTTKCKWDTPINLEHLWELINSIKKDERTPILMFAQTPFDKVLGASNLQMLKYEWIWEKTQATGHLNAKKMPMKAHENILVFYNKLPTYNPQKTNGHKPVNNYTKSVKNGTADGEIYGKTGTVSGGGNTDRYPRSVLTFSSDKQTSCIHPTQKPLAALEYLVKTYTNPNDLIIDVTCGIGTTNKACDILGRRSIGIDNGFCEKDKIINGINIYKRSWVELAEMRINNEL